MLGHTRTHLSLVSVLFWALYKGQRGFKLGIFVHVLDFLVLWVVFVLGAFWLFGFFCLFWGLLFFGWVFFFRMIFV